MTWETDVYTDMERNIVCTVGGWGNYVLPRMINHSGKLVQCYIYLYLLSIIDALYSLHDSCIMCLHYSSPKHAFSKMCDRSNSYNTSITAEAPSDPSQAVPKSHFSEHVKAMHKERDSGFEKEYMVCMHTCMLMRSVWCHIYSIYITWANLQYIICMCTFTTASDNTEFDNDLTWILLYCMNV